MDTVLELEYKAPARARKPYTITKQRERWTDDEHSRFMQALTKYGRAWRTIEEHVGTKTAVQIRSHAQKFFTKLEKQKELGDGRVDQTLNLIPPPRPKRKPMHPYPKKDFQTDTSPTLSDPAPSGDQACTPAAAFVQRSNWGWPGCRAPSSSALEDADGDSGRQGYATDCGEEHKRRHVQAFTADLEGVAPLSAAPSRVDLGMNTWVALCGPGQHAPRREVEQQVGQTQHAQLPQLQGKGSNAERIPSPGTHAMPEQALRLALLSALASQSLVSPALAEQEPAPGAIPASSIPASTNKCAAPRAAADRPPLTEHPLLPYTMPLLNQPLQTAMGWEQFEGQRIQGLGDVSEATLNAVATAAATAAAAAAAAVIAAAGEKVQAHLQNHPFMSFPFFGIRPEQLLAWAAGWDQATARAGLSPQLVAMHNARIMANIQAGSSFAHHEQQQLPASGPNQLQHMMIQNQGMCQPWQSHPQWAPQQHWATGNEACSPADGEGAMASQLQSNMLMLQQLPRNLQSTGPGRHSGQVTELLQQQQEGIMKALALQLSGQQPLTEGASAELLSRKLPVPASAVPPSAGKGSTAIGSNTSDPSSPNLIETEALGSMASNLLHAGTIQSACALDGALELSAGATGRHESSPVKLEMGGGSGVLEDRWKGPAPLMAAQGSDGLLGGPTHRWLHTPTSLGGQAWQARGAHRDSSQDLPESDNGGSLVAPEVAWLLSHLDGHSNGSHGLAAQRHARISRQHTEGLLSGGSQLVRTETSGLEDREHEESSEDSGSLGSVKNGMDLVLEHGKRFLSADASGSSELLPVSEPLVSTGAELSGSPWGWLQQGRGSSGSLPIDNHLLQLLASSSTGLLPVSQAGLGEGASGSQGLRCNSMDMEALAQAQAQAQASALLPMLTQQLLAMPSLAVSSQQGQAMSGPGASGLLQPLQRRQQWPHPTFQNCSGGNVSQLANKAASPTSNDTGQRAGNSHTDVVRPTASQPHQPEHGHFHHHHRFDHPQQQPGHQHHHRHDHLLQSGHHHYHHRHTLNTSTSQQQWRGASQGESGSAQLGQLAGQRMQQQGVAKAQGAKQGVEGMGNTSGAELGTMRALGSASGSEDDPGGPPVGSSGNATDSGNANGSGNGNGNRSDGNNTDSQPDAPGAGKQSGRAAAAKDQTAGCSGNGSGTRIQESQRVAGSNGVEGEKGSNGHTLRHSIKDSQTQYHGSSGNLERGLSTEPGPPGGVRLHGAGLKPWALPYKQAGGNPNNASSRPPAWLGSGRGATTTSPSPAAEGPMGVPSPLLPMKSLSCSIGVRDSSGAARDRGTRSDLARLEGLVAAAQTLGAEVRAISPPTTPASVPGDAGSGLAGPPPSTSVAGLEPLLSTREPPQTLQRETLLPVQADHALAPLPIAPLQLPVAVLSVGAAVAVLPPGLQDGEDLQQLLGMWAAHLVGGPGPAAWRVALALHAQVTAAGLPRLLPGPLSALLPSVLPGTTLPSLGGGGLLPFVPSPPTPALPLCVASPLPLVSQGPGCLGPSLPLGVHEFSLGWMPQGVGMGGGALMPSLEQKARDINSVDPVAEALLSLKGGRQGRGRPLEQGDCGLPQKKRAL